MNATHWLTFLLMHILAVESFFCEWMAAVCNNGQTKIVFMCKPVKGSRSPSDGPSWNLISDKYVQ